LHVSLWLFLALSCYYCSTITLFGVESYYSNYEKEFFQHLPAYSAGNEH
jgi:hypothetical protein